MSIVWRIFGYACVLLSPFEVLWLWGQGLSTAIKIQILAAALIMLIAGLEILWLRVVIIDSTVYVRRFLKRTVIFGYGDITDIRIREGRSTTIFLRNCANPLIDDHTATDKSIKCTIPASVIRPRVLCEILNQGIADSRIGEDGPGTLHLGTRD